MGSSECSKPKDIPGPNDLNSSNDGDMSNNSNSSDLVDNQNPLKSDISLNSTNNDDIIPNATSLIKGDNNIHEDDERKKEEGKKYNEIKKILKVVVPMKNRNWALPGQIFVSMTPLA